MNITRLRGPRIAILVAIWVAALITILPVVFKWAAPPPHTGPDKYVRIGVGYLGAALLCFWMYHAEARKLPKRYAAALVFLTALLTLAINNLHGFMIDHGVSYFGQIENWKWQAQVQDLIIQLNPANIPHSYRFLPNAFVRWLQLARLDFEQARDLYRLFFNLLIFYTLYRYARRYTDYLGALLTMLLTAAVYPISFEFYGGQLTDPMSHLSFLLALIFIETGDFPMLLTTLVIGSLAKETVLAMTGYYILFCRRDSRYPFKAIALAASSMAVYFGVRMLVLHGGMHYRDVSGVTMDHIWKNLGDHRWPAVFCLTAGAFAPIVALGWKGLPVSLKQESIFLLVVLFLSSAGFSWLAESRNFMPLVFVLAAATARILRAFGDVSADRGTRTEVSTLSVV